MKKLILLIAIIFMISTIVVPSNSSSVEAQSSFLFPELSVADDVYSGYMQPSMQILSTITYPSIYLYYNEVRPTYWFDGWDTSWPSLDDAISVGVANVPRYRVFCTDKFVLNSNSTVVWKRCGQTTTIDDTANWPSLIDAIGIAALYYPYWNSGYEYKLQRFVLYKDKRVKYTVEGSSTEHDGSTRFDDLTNVTSIALIDANTSYAFDSVNKKVYGKNGGYPSYDYTSSWRTDLSSATGITGTYVSTYMYYSTYLNTRPVLNLTNGTQNQLVTVHQGVNTVTISGTIMDYQSDNVTISATLGGITKSTTVMNTDTTQPWSLVWTIPTDNVTVGHYTNLTISASDGVRETVTKQYTGTISINRQPNVPANLTLGSTTAASPTVVVPTPTVNWSFSDPDAGDVQSAYQIQFMNASDQIIYDSNWRTSSQGSFAVPAGQLSRGQEYSYKVRVKDNKGGISDYTSAQYIKINSIPVSAITSYADGQQLTINQLTFTWIYTDSDNQLQSRYQVQGSQDNWATVSYETGIIHSTLTTHTTFSLVQGEWDFRIRTFDGLEWSDWANRNNLLLPNSYEPNNTFSSAFSIQYNADYTTVIDSAADVDFYKFVATQTGIDRVTLVVPGGKNYDVIIYDANMNEIATGTKSSGMEDVLFVTTNGNTYYIKVYGTTSADFGSDLYSLKVIHFGVTSGIHRTNYEYDNNGNMYEKSTITE